MAHNISQMKNKASQGRSLGGFWSQIARNKCAILILALKLPFLEWSQHRNLCSTAHTKLETLLVFWFAFLKKKSSELWVRFATPPTPTLEVQEDSITFNSQAGYKQTILLEKRLFLFFPSSPSSFSLVWEVFPGLPITLIGLTRSLALFPFNEGPSPAASSGWTFAVFPAPGKYASPSWCVVWLRSRGECIKRLHPAMTICQSSLSQAVWQHHQRKGSVWLPIKTPYWRWIYVWSISNHIGLQLII